MKISYEDKGYQLEVYPFNGDLISVSHFELKDSLEDTIKVVEKLIIRLILPRTMFIFLVTTKVKKEEFLVLKT